MFGRPAGAAAMALDPRTLLVAAMSVSLFVAVLSLVVGRVNRFRAATEMGITVLLLAAGFTALALRGLEISERASVYLGGAFTLAGMVWLTRVARSYRGIPLRDITGWSVAALTLLAMVGIYESGTVPRTVLASLHTGVLALLVARAAWLFATDGGSGLRAARFLTVGVLVLTIAMLGVRSALVLRAPAFTVLSAGGGSTSLLVGAAVFVLGTTFGVLWLELGRLQGRLERLAATDPLTGLRNRRSLRAEFEREAARTRRGAGVFSAAMFDLDHFKRVNDRHGHAAGDHVLREFARLLNASVRGLDIVARVGGEEFLVLMPGTTKAAARGVAERILRATAAATASWLGGDVRVTVSAGVATFGEDGSDFDALMESADRALYASKKAGRNRVTVAGEPPAPGAAPEPAYG